MIDVFFLYYYNSFHNKLKNNARYLDHKPNRRVDDLISVLLKFESDTYIAQRMKEVLSIATN